MAKKTKEEKPKKETENEKVNLGEPTSPPPADPFPSPDDNEKKSTK